MKFFTTNKKSNSLNYHNAVLRKITKFTDIYTTSVNHIIGFNHIYYELEKYQHLYHRYLVVSLWSFLEAVKRKNKIKFTSKGYLSIKRNKKQTLVERFLNLLLRSGLKIKYLNFLNLSVLNLYYNFYFFNKNTKVLYNSYEEFVSLIPTFKNFYNFSTLLQVLVMLLEPFFYIRIKRVEKKYRKHLKKKFVGQPVYVNPLKRTNLVLRSLIYYLNLFSNYQLHLRLSSSLFKTLIEQRSSYLYKRKLYMYGKIFKKYQNKVI